MNVPVDRPAPARIVQRDRVYTGKVWAIDRDLIEYNEGTLVRDFLKHMGAVAVVAVDEQERVLCITQYRHATGQVLVEIPAGLLDVAGEEYQAAAARELLEESGYKAEHWQVLVDFFTTPGSSSEAIRIFVAKGLSAVEVDRSWMDDEERDIEVHWVPLADAVAAILDGFWQSPTAVSGVLAYAAGRGSNLRPADAAWPARDFLVATDRVFTLPQ